jgi:hypothetical protein
MIFCLVFLVKVFCYFQISKKISMVEFHFLLKIHYKANETKVLSQLFTYSLLMILLRTTNYYHLAFKYFSKKMINSDSANSIIYHFLNCLMLFLHFSFY